MICTEKLYLTSDRKKLVGHGDKAAAFLYASPGDEIPASAAEMFGLKDGALPVKGGAKEKAPPANKGGKAPANKGGKAAADKAAPAPADKQVPAPADKAA